MPPATADGQDSFQSRDRLRQCCCYGDAAQAKLPSLALPKCKHPPVRAHGQCSYTRCRTAPDLRDNSGLWYKLPMALQMVPVLQSARGQQLGLHVPKSADRDWQACDQAWARIHAKVLIACFRGTAQLQLLIAPACRPVPSACKEQGLAALHPNPSAACTSDVF